MNDLQEQWKYAERWQMQLGGKIWHCGNIIVDGIEVALIARVIYIGEKWVFKEWLNVHRVQS